MANPPSTAQIEDAAYQTIENWSRRPPQEMWDQAGAFGKMVQKEEDSTWKGDEFIKVPIDRSHGGNAGSSMVTAIELATPYAGDKFAVPIRQLWVGARLDWLYEKLLRDPAAWRDTKTGVMKLMLARVMAYWKHFSYTIWGDGSGRIAKGDGSYSVAGAVITFKNRACVRRFEEGDVIVLIDQAATSPFTPRNGKRTVIARNERAGTITLDGNVNTITGAANTDYIGKHVDFAEVGKRPIHGIEEWIPRTDAAAATTFNGVNRSTDVGRLAGRRVKLSGSETPYQVITKLLQEDMDVGANINTIFAPSIEMTRLMEEMRANNVIWSTATTAESKKYLTMGVSVIRATFPGRDTPIDITADRYLHDIETTEEEDVTYWGLNMPTWNFKTVDGVKWQNPVGTGPWQQIVGTQEKIATHGGFGNIYTDGPGRNIIASKRVLVS